MRGGHQNLIEGLGFGFRVCLDQGASTRTLVDRMFLPHPETPTVGTCNR